MSELINIINHVFDDFGLPPTLYGTKRFLSDEICELILESGIHYNISMVGIDEVEVTQDENVVITKPHMVTTRTKEIFRGSIENFERWIIELYIYDL